MPKPVNIVFDIGNVICEWNPPKLVNSVFDDEEERACALANIIGHDDWLMLDKGTIALQNAILRAVKRCGLKEQQVIKLFEETPKSLVPFPETVQILGPLKERGFNLYVLSNMHDYAFDYLLSHYHFWHHFSGIVISSAIKSIKPEAQIFQHLLKHYNLNAEETLFLDDMQVNVEAARKHGIEALLVHGQAKLKKRLFEKLGLY